MTRLLVAHERGSVPVCDICPTGISVGHASLHGRFWHALKDFLRSRENDKITRFRL